MSSTAPRSNRVRQIAILVSSVDAAAARQLLLHLPTGLARQVRAMAANLGDVSPDEKREVVAEFQRATAHERGASLPAAETNLNSGWSGAADAFYDPHEKQDPSSSQAVELTKEGSASRQKTGSPSWTKLTTQELLRFVSGERVTVMAVVISQLDAAQAVEVLSQLPREVGHAVIQQLSHLQDIDPDATAAIDEHLAERLSEYQHRIESQCENSRRLKALLDAAPPDLQQEWASVLHGHAPPNERESRSEVSRTTPSAIASPTVVDLYGDAVLTTHDSFGGVWPLVEPELADSEWPDQLTKPDTIPFPTADVGQRFSAVERIFLQSEFEQILKLSPHNLAALLSSMDSPTVLLALAGSTPEFMQRFTRLLNPQDAKLLSRRMQAIGKIKLREVDTAQQKIIDKALAMFDHPSLGRRAAA